MSNGRMRRLIVEFEGTSSLFSSTSKFDRGSWRGKISKFLSKIFWHFNRVVPNYSSINSSHSTEKYLAKSTPRPAQPRSIYFVRPRQRLSRQRLSTLVSIEEENEFELMNCI